MPSRPSNFGVDPTRVSTARELAACLNALRRQQGLSYEGMEKAARDLPRTSKGLAYEPLGKSTVGEIVTGVRLPTLGKLQTFLAVCQIPARNFPLWRSAWERASSSASGDGDAQAYAVVRPTPETPYRLEAIIPNANPDLNIFSRRGPSHLLDAAHQVVPYRRRAEEQLLDEWCQDESERVSVLLIQGRGGEGKTRLAAEFASRLLRRGWVAANAVDAPSGNIKGGARSNFAKRSPICVVVDYAERWQPGRIAQLVADISAASQDRLVRIILLARTGIGLWETLEAAFNRAVGTFRDPIDLSPFLANHTELDEAFREAFDAFRQALGLSPSKAALPSFGEEPPSPLILHMSALAAVVAERDNEDSPSYNDLSAYLLMHERRYWLSFISHEATSVQATEVVERIARAVFVATLFGPTEAPLEAREILREALAPGADAEAEALLARHRQLYPGWSPAGYTAAASASLVPLRPDRLGEDFVADYLRRPGALELLELLLSSAMRKEPTVTPAGRRRALLVIAAAAERHKGVRDCLFALLDKNPDLFAYINSAGKKYFLHSKRVVLRGGKEQTIYFYANELRRADFVFAVPDSFEVHENPRNGFLTLKKSGNKEPGGFMFDGPPAGRTTWWSRYRRNHR